MRARILTLILLTLFILAGCDRSIQDTAQDSTSETENIQHHLAELLPIEDRDFLIGVAGFVPRNFPNSGKEDWEDLFSNIDEYGEVFGDYVAWDDGVTDNGMPDQIATAVEVTRPKDMLPLIAIGFPQDLTKEESDSYFHEYGERFKETAVKVAETYSPEYLALGVEVSRLHEFSPEGFDRFIVVYKETYDAIKKVSPDTKVFSIFQLENMKGAARLTGRTHPPQWEIIDMFGDKLDVIGFTTYPYLEYDSVEDIPNDYYTSITDHTDLPIAFTEMGWPTDSDIVQGDQDAQVNFLLKLLESTEDLDVELMVWSFPHDVKSGVAGGIFDSISMKKNNGEEKKVFQYWKALNSLK